MITCKITTRPRADGGLFFPAGWRGEALCRPSGQEVSGAGRNPGTGGWNSKGAAQGASPLSRASGAAIKKVPGQCANTPPAGTARERTLLSYTVVLLSMFRPRRMPPDGGLCLNYIRVEARSIRQRSVSSVKTIRRLMRLGLLYPYKRSLRCAERVEANRVASEL